MTFSVFGRVPKLCCHVKAFTLAEVLITLGIIGVVAALTIPALMQKTNDKEMVAGVAKAQSVLSNAVKEMETIEGTKMADYTDDSAFATNFKKHLKAVSECEDYSICLADGSAFNLMDFAAGCTTDGSEFGDSPSLKNTCANVALDVNGAKGPNKFGKDQYMFAVTKNGIIPFGNQSSSTCAGKDCAAYVLFNNKLADSSNFTTPESISDLGGEALEADVCGGQPKPDEGECECVPIDKEGNFEWQCN